MGRGNSIIIRKDGLQATNTYYIELGEKENDWSWQEVIEILQDFKLKGQDNKSLRYSDNFRNNFMVILETKVMQVIISDNENGDMAVGCVPLPYGLISIFNMPAFKKQANYYMKMLNKQFDLRVRAGTYGSSKAESTKTNFY